jgi:uncharacterized cupredoxin-like copper-binding protein
MSIRGWLAMVVVASVTAAGCGSSANADQATKAATKASPTVVRITLSEWQVRMSRTSIPANKPVTFIISNAGAVEHEMVLEPSGSDDKPYDLSGVSGTDFESEVESIHPGSTISVTWRLPGKGRYQLACHVPGHFERGMVSKFTAA